MVDIPMALQQRGGMKRKGRSLCSTGTKACCALGLKKHSIIPCTVFSIYILYLLDLISLALNIKTYIYIE